MTHPFISKDDHDQYIEDFVKAFSDVFDIELITLSGSVYSDNATPYSDIDLEFVSSTSKFKLPSNLMYRSLPIDFGVIPIDELENYFKNPGDPIYTMAFGSTKNSRILYAKNNEIRDRYEHLRGIKPTDDQMEEQKNQAIEKLKEIPSRIGNLFLHHKEVDLYSIKEYALLTIQFLICYTAMYNHQLLNRNHGLSDRDIAGNNLPDEFQSSVIELLQSEDKITCISLLSKLYKITISYIEEVPFKTPQSFQSKQDETLSKINRLLSEYHKPDRVGFFVNYFKFYPVIEEYYETGLISHSLFEQLDYRRIKFDQSSINEIMKLRQIVLDKIDGALKLTSFEALKKALKSYSIETGSENQ